MLNISPEKLIVHSGTMHADDVMTAALLTFLFPELTVERLFDAKITEEMKSNPKVMICDAGKEYDPSRNLYDHHNECPVREDGMPHAALGLVLMHFRDMIGDDAYKMMRDDIDMIEHIDNGQSHEGYDPGAYNLVNLVRVMNPAWNSSANPDDMFEEAVSLLRRCYIEPIMNGIPVMEKELKAVYEKRLAEARQSESEAEQIVMSAYDKAENGIVILPVFVPFQKYLCDTDADYVIFPSVRGGVNIQCVPVEPDSFDVKRELPDWSADKPEGLIFEFGAGDPSKIRFLANFETVEQACEAIK